VVRFKKVQECMFKKTQSWHLGKRSWFFKKFQVVNNKNGRISSPTVKDIVTGRL
jgi:hypothetical protein